MKKIDKYLDTAEPVNVRVNDLLGKMTLEEKIQQMGMGNCINLLNRGKFSPEIAGKLFGKRGIGALQDPRLDPKNNAKIVNAVQKFLKRNTRLGIPSLIVSECLHGHMSGGATIFPQAIGLASTWNPLLIKEMASAAAKEARAVGVTQSLAPDLDLARDPRWGRVEETYGEDPYLCSQMGVAYVKGIQGEGEIIDSEHLIATLKHFAAHGSPESGLNISPVAVGPRELRELYLPPFKKAVVEAGALSVMPAYSEFDGIPCSMSKELLTGILRKEWGFKGYVFSDYGAITMLVNTHHTAANMDEAGRLSLEAGMDLEAPSIAAFGKNLKILVENGELSIQLIDLAVSRILRIKFLAGLFENPYVDVKESVKIINSHKYRKLARSIAQESIILLKNRGDLLPLDKNCLKSIAVIGPNADVVQLGNYSVAKNEVVTPLQAIRNAVSSKVKVIYEKGCGIWEKSKDGFVDAVEAVRQSDAAIVFVGGSSMVQCGIGWGGKDVNQFATCGEGFDRADINLPGVQQELIEAVVAAKRPVIVVMVNGRPYSILWIAEHVHAILEAWYPGEQGGNALADIIFGKVNPSAKLPVSFPRTVGQVPVFYNHKPSARGHYHQPGSSNKPGRDYVFAPTKPLFEFGYGLSYTRFKYSNLRVTPQKIGRAGKLKVKVDIQNIGKLEGKEVVQLYINDEVSSVTTPVKALRRLKKINLTPRQKKSVEFELGPDDLALLDQHMEWVVEPGKFEVMIGGLKKKFAVA